MLKSTSRPWASVEPIPAAGWRAGNPLRYDCCADWSRLTESGRNERGQRPPDHYDVNLETIKRLNKQGIQL